ncbi:MAG: hypothetical protein ACI8RZ_001315 [Myxococcota bacterium]|jgi:hypothetical protein
MPTLVTAALIAAPLIAGGTSWVGVKYTVAPGWHIYWENPGETGIPTTVDLTLPEGFTVGPVQYPGPETFMMPGDLTNYGYEGEVVLLAELTAPAALPGDGQIAAETHWLVCRPEQCIPGNTALTLSLDAMPADETAAFADHLPGPLPSTATRLTQGLTTTITFFGPQAGEVYPDTALEGVLAAKSVTPGPGGLAVTLTLNEPAPAGAAVVIRVEQPAGEAHYRVLLGE